MVDIQPRENKRSEYIKPKRRGKFSGPVLFALVVVAVVFVMSVTFRVNSITVRGNEHYTDQEIVNAIDIEEGDNLFFFDRFAAVSRVFAKLPYVEEVQVIRNLPDKVTIEVKETTAIAYIKIGTELWTIDHNCKILGKAAEGEEGSLIPVIGFDPGTLFIGKVLQSSDGSTRSIDFLAAILNQLKDRGLTAYAKRIDITNASRVKMYYGDKYIVELGDPSSTEQKFSMLVSALPKLKEGDIGIIDLRDGSSVRFRPH